MMPGSAWGGLWGGHRHQEGEEMGASEFFMSNFGPILGAKMVSKSFKNALRIWSVFWAVLAYI